jgi:hypothetical protein
MMPFWFWNDDLEEAELLRQLAALRAGGMGGVVIHPRTGLSRAVGYLTPEYFRLVRRVVEACAALGMKVVLYDEGGYPSGSACGAVVAEDPHHAAHALALVRCDLEGPHRGYWRPSLGRSLQQRLVTAVLARRVGEGIDPSSLTPLQPLEHGLLRLEVTGGPWCALACLEIPSGGTMRGVLPEQEDGSALAPPAADLLQPEAVATFLRLTHARYAAELGEHLGRTVVALFTDEPSLLGRGARRGIQPYTPGLELDIAARLGWSDVRPWLPALWVDYGPETASFRRAYAAALDARLQAVFYSAQARWCEAHGLALTGHPADSDDMASLATFHWPGQDVVWRWVVPGDGSGLRGPHSVAPKAAVSAAAAAGRRRAASELFGAYGWRLSSDEAKWLLDWHLARGVNLLFPHACFYSLRDGRAFESEPDIGPHNPWWPYFQHLAAYSRRLCWLLTEAAAIRPVAVLADGRHLPWEAVRPLYEHQIDFLYLDAGALEHAAVRGGRLCLGNQSFQAVVLAPDTSVPPQGQSLLAALAAAGGAVLPAAPAADLAARLARAVPLEAVAEPPCPDLRLLRLQWRGLDLFACFHEGEAAMETTLVLQRPCAASLQAGWWDPLRDALVPADTTVDADGGLRVRLSLPRRESRVLLLARCDDAAGAVPAPRRNPGDADAVWPLAGPWMVQDAAGRPVAAPGPGDWSRVPALERFAGTLTYRLILRRPPEAAAAELDLGRVGEAAEVFLNGRPAGWTAWAPYRVPLARSLWRAGENLLEVRVTNSAANAFEGALRPSGLLGPVTLRLWFHGAGAVP